MSLRSKVSIMVLGEMAVGKTSLLLRFNKGKFSAYNASTSINRYFKDIRVMNTDVQLELYDTGGHDRFRDIIKTNYHKVDGVLLVYDVMDVTSFYKLSSWLDEVRSANEKVSVIIVGNKSDDADKKSVSQMMVKSYAFKENLEYYEGSAKTGENVKNIFERITQKVLEVRNGVSQPIHNTESQNSVHSTQSQSKDTIDSPASNPPTLPQPIDESASICSSHSTQSPGPSTNQIIQLDPSSNEREDSEESEWCFPDLEYLNSKNQKVGNSVSKDDLPPIVPLPDDIIKLHIEKSMNIAKQKAGGKTNVACV